MNGRFIGVRRSETVDDAEGQGLGVDAAAGGDGRAVVLKLEIDFKCEMIGKNVIDATARGVDVGDGV